MKRRRASKKGFTLVEVIVVLVILAILAVVMIPSLRGWIDRAKEKQLVAACRACVTAAQTLASETYGLSGTATIPEAQAILELAEVSGDVSGIVLDTSGAAVDKLTYTDGSNSVTYYRLPKPHYEVGGRDGGASTQRTEFVNYISQWLNAGNSFARQNGKKDFFSDYYQRNPTPVEMDAEYKQKLIDAGLNSTLKNQKLYWWSYPVTDRNGEVLYTVTYANNQSSASNWTDDNRGKMNGGYVVIVNGKTYYHSNASTTVQPGNVTNSYQTEDALEAALINNKYKVLAP